MSFNVGDKVRHAAYGDVEVAFGPFLHNGESDSYLVRGAHGSHKVAAGDRLTRRVALTVGDAARCFSEDVTVAYGPYKAVDGGPDVYVVRFANGLEGSFTASQLTPLPTTPTVGDTVRITGDTMYGDLPNGTVGVLRDIDSSDGFRYRVHSDERNDYDWAVSVERA